MVAHLMAAGMFAAATLGATQDCERPDDLDENGGRSKSANRLPAGDDHDDEGGSPPCSIRAIERSDPHPNSSQYQHQPQSSFSYRTADGSIRLGPTIRKGDRGGELPSPRGGAEKEPPTPLPSNVGTSSSVNFSGFVQGNFGAGKVHEVKLPPRTTCYTLAFHPCRHIPLLAVGLSEGLAFYETESFSLVYQQYLDDMVSALSWIPQPEESLATRRSQTLILKQANPPQKHNSSDTLLAAGTLDGWISLYRVNVHILETQGPTLLHRFSVAGQIRALTTCYINSNVASTSSLESTPPTLLIACGTKNGAVTAMLWNDDAPESSPSISTLMQESTAVLGLDIDARQCHIAWSTKSGQVVARKLCVHGRDRRSEAVVSSETRAPEDDTQIDADRILWYTQRQGPVRCVVFSQLQPQLIFGGYDKTVVIVDTEIWAVCRQLSLQGTVNTISLDLHERYLTVGSRDKTFRMFDTSTYVNIKTFQTPGWVTSISWLASDLPTSGRNRSVVAIRSDNSTVSLLNLSPIELVDDPFPSSKATPGSSLVASSSLSWTPCGRYLARTSISKVIISDSFDGFAQVGSVELPSSVVRVAFRHGFSRDDNPKHQFRNCLAVIDSTGSLHYFALLVETSSKVTLHTRGSCPVEDHLKALAWAPNGRIIATGGRGGKLHLLDATTLVPARIPVDLGARIWDIDFVRTPAVSSTYLDTAPFSAAALGDYTAVLMNGSFEPILRIMRSRTVRCLTFHPTMPLLSVGDGEGVVSIVDYVAEEIIRELPVHGRVNVVKFSPIGDCLLVGTDDCVFQLHETSCYEPLQLMKSCGFALVAEFSPNGSCLVLGGSDTDSYTLVRLGPFLSIDLFPIGTEVSWESLPTWALNEVLFRSGYGPSFIQRHMIKGGHENLARVAEILRHHSDALYAFNRQTGEGCFDTALALKRPTLLKLAVTMLVDGTLEDSHDGQKSILTTEIPLRGRQTLLDFVENYPPDFIVNILHSMTFTKVPFTEPHFVEMHNHRRLECSSHSFMDPWSLVLCESVDAKLSSIGLGKKFERTRGQIQLTPAVLPLPSLGDLDFLSSLLLNAPPNAFDNDAMALVLGVMWRDHIRKFFIIDCIVFASFFACWIVLLELLFSSNAMIPTTNDAVTLLSLVVVGLNSLFLSKEIIQSGFCRRKTYFLSIWNWVDVAAILCIYVFVLAIFVSDLGVSLIPLAVVTTLLLTVKLLSYLRGFKDTGWLISVLIANFRDVRGFLVILCSILLGFSVAFRLLFGDLQDASFQSLRKSFLSTFEITILGTYETSVLYDQGGDNIPFRALATFTFILAVTCVFVVCLNALISILADSYAKVQEHAAANRLNERAALIVEYLTLLPSWYRRKIEQRTRWFHVLLEVDAQDNLLVKNEDWEGGLNLLRREMQAMEERVTVCNQKLIEHMKTELDLELLRFKKEVLSTLGDLSDDIKKIHSLQSEGGITFSGKNVAKAVKAVKSLQRKGESMFNPKY